VIRPLAASALLLLLAAPCGGQGAGRARQETAHYVLTTSGDAAEAAEWGRVLEAAWPQYEEFFGATPKLADGERLRVAVYEEDPAFRDAIQAGGGAAPSSGGYYCPVAKMAYLKRQPSAWYTRNLLLHEAAHQFHYFARTRNEKPHGSWYIEGVAEHLGGHTWDGETLRTGVTPLLSLEDRAGQALEEVGGASFSLAGLLEAESASRPPAMFLVRYLMTAQDGRLRKKFDTLSRKLDRGSRIDAKGFFKLFGKEKKLLPAFREWLATAQEPLTPVFVEWDARGPHHVRGNAGVVSTCRTRGPARRIAALLRPERSGPFKAGLLLSHMGPGDYTVFLVRGQNGRSESYRIDRMKNGKWTTLRSGAAAGPSPIRVVAERPQTGGMRVWVGGVTIEDLNIPAGAFGLAFDNCRVDFTGIEIQLADE